jgi:DNA-binding MarR family transcriptional regulator
VRERDAADRRVINVALTETGRQLMAGMVAYRRERLRVLLGDLTDEELGCLLMGTRALRRARERLMAEPDPTAAHAHRAGHRPRRHGHPEAHA